MSTFGFHFGDMVSNQYVIVKGYQNMSKTMHDIFDNGLTKKQQEQVDKAFEELMDWVKSVDKKLYDKMQSETITYEKFMKNKEIEEKGVTIDEDNQINLF
jgi:hypothetical protein